MVNVDLLKKKIVEKNISVEKLASLINIDKSTLYRKISNNAESISIREANMIVKVLELTTDEAVAIFFARCVA